MTKDKRELRMLWALASSSSSVDQATNNVSLFSVLEQVQFKIDDPVILKRGMPPEGAVIPFPFDVIATIVRTGSKEGGREITGKLIITDPSGKTMLDAPMNSAMESGKGRLRLTLKFDGFKVTTSGDYRISLFLKEGNEFHLDSEILIEVSVEVGSEK